MLPAPFGSVRRAAASILWLGAAASVALATDPPPMQKATADTPAAVAHGCLPTGDGYLRASIRGALNLDIDWKNAEIECDGGPRPDGSALRISFAGPQHQDGRRLRLVFGVESVREGRSGSELPTNLTVIFEVDRLTQERLGALGGSQRHYRVMARGFCVAPASTLDDRARILVSSFDFAGAVLFDEPTPTPATGKP